MFELTHTPNLVINHPHPASQAHANRTKRQRKRPSKSTNFHQNKIQKIETQSHVKIDGGPKLDDSHRRGNSDGVNLRADQRNLLKVIETVTKTFAPFSRRPGTGWLEQEWVLLQLTEINGVGDKGTNCHQSKTAVNAYGQKEGIAKFHSWCTSTKEGGDGFVNRTPAIRVFVGIFY
jgi:hypothetical protein